MPSDKLGRRTRLTDPSKKALDHFYSALRGLQNGTRERARVAFFGASHMAADSFTRVFRHRLQGLFGDAGPGFVVPARPWKNYNHRDVTLAYSKGWKSYWVSNRHGRADGRYGLAGCSFESGDKAEFCRMSTRKKGEFGRSVSKVELYYWQQPGGGDLLITVDQDPPRIIKTAATEAGPGYAKFDLVEGEHTVELRPVGNGDVMLFGVALERDQRGVVVDTMGINGARASAVLQWAPEVFGEQLKRRNPDLVVLAYGTNATGDKGEAMGGYAAQLDKAISQVRAAVPKASCIYVGPSDRPFKVVRDGRTGDWKSPKRPKTKAGRRALMKRLHFLPRPRQARVIATQKRIAHKNGCAYWDWTKMMGGPLSMVKWVHSEPRLGARDYVHLTGNGYARAAGFFWKAVMGGYGRLPEPKAP